MLNHALSIATAMLAVALLLCCYRLWRGPTACDRILALDSLYITALTLLVVQDIRSGTQWYFEVALLIAALGFFATVVMAKYVMDDSVLDRDASGRGVSNRKVSDGDTNNASAAD